MLEQLISFLNLDNISITNLLVVLWVTLPVSLIGAWRWGIWLLRKLLGSTFYRPNPTISFASTVTVVTPVYNEDPVIFRRALESWADELRSLGGEHSDGSEIIAVIDYTDETCIAVFDEFAETFAGAKRIITYKPGKRPALVDGSRAATGEIVALVDSDTIWEAGMLPHVLAPFQDETVGGVAPRQNVLTPGSLPERLFDIHLDIRYFDEMRFLGATCNALTCISGRTAVYRREAMLPLLDGLMNETFWGKQVISGDDKCLTNLLQSAGWKVRYQESARVYTPAFSDMRVFIKQRLRWTRNSWRADLRSLWQGWVFREPALAFHLMDRVIQPLTTLVAPLFLTFAAYRQDWGLVLTLLIWWLVSRVVKIWPSIQRDWRNLLILPAYIFFSFFFSIVKIYAFFTMNTQGWITRWDKNRLVDMQMIRLLPAYGATVAVVCAVAFGVLTLQSFLAQQLSNICDDPYRLSRCIYAEYLEPEPELNTAYNLELQLASASNDFLTWDLGLIETTAQVALQVTSTVSTTDEIQTNTYLSDLFVDAFVELKEETSAQVIANRWTSAAHRAIQQVSPRLTTLQNGDISENASLSRAESEMTVQGASERVWVHDATDHYKGGRSYSVVSAVDANRPSARQPLFSVIDLKPGYAGGAAMSSSSHMVSIPDWDVIEQQAWAMTGPDLFDRIAMARRTDSGTANFTRLDDASSQVLLTATLVSNGPTLNTSLSGGQRDGAIEPIAVIPVNKKGTLPPIVMKNILAIEGVDGNPINAIQRLTE